MKKYLHNYARYLECELELLKNSDIPLQNKQLILDFKDYNLVNGISVPRLVRQASVLRLVSQQIQKPFAEITAKDFERFFVWMKNQNYKEESLNTYKEIVRVFFKWLNKGKYPDCVTWFKSNYRNKNQKLPKELLTQEEIKSILKATNSPRDKALIALLWESGARIGEIGTLQLKHCQFDDFGCQIILDGKTGMRRIRIVNTAPILLDWINTHPLNNNPNASLWVTLTKKQTRPLVYQYITKVITSAGKRANIQKPLNPHHFRHSRATYMSQFLTEAQMKEYFGWTQDSKMAARYVHLSGKQVDDAILRMHGLKKQEQKEDILQQQLCPRCKNPNDINNQYCSHCWLPLTLQAISEVEQTREKDQQAMAAILKLIDLAKGNPQLLQQALTQVTQKKEVN